MASTIDKWNHFKEIVGAEYALTELEKALGVYLLTDHIRFILRMNDYEYLVQTKGGGE